VTRDYAEAAKWYGLAAAQGDADAQYSLGILYDNGTGVVQDDTEAAKWFRLAADQVLCQSAKQSRRLIHQGARRAAGLRPSLYVVRLIGGAGQPAGSEE
jgi:hypothetical protein